MAETPTDYPQGVQFNASDLWEAFEAGARSGRTHQPDDYTISRSADAYVKLLHAKVRDGELDREYNGGSCNARVEGTELRCDRPNGHSGVHKFALRTAASLPPGGPQHG